MSFGITQRLLFDLFLAEHLAHADRVDDVFDGAALNIGRREADAPCEDIAGRLRFGSSGDRRVDEAKDDQGTAPGYLAEDARRKGLWEVPVFALALLAEML